MSTQGVVAVDQPALNSIPDHLVSRFEPVFVNYWNKYNVGRFATHQVPIEDYRKDPVKYTVAYGRQIVKEPYSVTEQTCPVDGGEITIRIFEPGPQKPGDKPRAAYVNFHGGGWVFGGLMTDFEFCKRVVNELGCVAFDVDYRLAPEYKFPIPVDDCWKAFNWIRDEKKDEFNLDLERFAVGGCSAGGHLSAVIALKCREAKLPLAFQLLSVPVCDLHVFTPEGELIDDCPYPSYVEMAKGVPLSLARMSYFHKHFLGNPRPEKYEHDWSVSPIKTQNFSNLAPALVITAEMDVLRDEGEAYGRKLIEGGTKTEIIRIKGAPHTVMTMDDILEGGKQYNRETLRCLGEALGMVADG